MSTRPPTVAVIDGHMTHTRTRRELGKPYEESIFDWNDKPIGTRTKHHPGRIFVEVLVWQGEEATGSPVAEWEMPHVYRYDHDAAARQAVVQTRFPEVTAKSPDWVFPPTAAEAEQWPKETFVITRQKRDGTFERLSGRDFTGKLDALEAAMISGLKEAPLWLKIHRDNVGTPVTSGSATMSMLFTVGKITGLDRRSVDVVIEEPVPKEGS